jgi:hypothetical protein
MSGVGNTASGATIFSENTTSGGPNDVTVANLVVQQDLRVDGNFEVGTFSIDDLTVNDDLNVTDELTVGGNTYAQFLETALDINCKGDLLVEETIVCDGLASLNGGIAVATDKFTVAAVTGNTIIKGTLQVDGGITGVAAGTVTGAVQYRGASGDFDADDAIVYTPAAKRLRTTDGSNTVTVEPTVVCVSDGTNTGGFQMTGGTFCTGTLNALALGIKTNNTTRMTVNGSTGQVAITNGIASSSPTTGALVVTGGVGVGGQIWGSARIQTSGPIATTSTTGSSNVSTGALTVGGGVGVAQNIHAGGTLTVAGAVGFSSDLGSSARIITSNAENSTTTTTGSIRTAGGVGIVGDVNVGGYVRALDGLSTLAGQTPFIIQFGTTGSGSGGTVTFGTAFSATPTVTHGWQRGGAVDSVYMTAVSASAFTWASTISLTALHWMAIGPP